MNKATQAGKGKIDGDNVVKFNPQDKTSKVDPGDAIPSKQCVNEGCSVETSTPYAKTHDQGYLCSRECEQAHKAKNGGAWGSLPTADS